jgi:hypothetical protein
MTGFSKVRAAVCFPLCIVATLARIAPILIAFTVALLATLTAHASRDTSATTAYARCSKHDLS